MKKKLLSFFMSLAIAITTIFPSSVLSALALDTANVDLTLNVPKDTVLSGNSAVFELDLKVAGSQESINEEIGNYSVLTVNLPNDLKDYYELDESNLAIDNIVPVYDRDNSTLTYKFPELKTGLSVRKFIKLKTKNGITPNGTELNVSAILSKSDGSSMASTENKKIIVQSSLKPSISKKFEKIVQDETAYAARPGNEVVYKVTASIPAPVNSNPGSLYLKGGSDIVISDTLDSRLTYVNSSFSNSSATTSVDGQTVNWTFKAPSVADQARNNEYIFETEFYITVKVSEQISSDTFIENAVNITATTLDGTKVENLTSNKVKVNVLLPGSAVNEGAQIPVRVTVGPGGSTNGVQNPNKGQTEDQAVGFTDVYTVGANREENIINYDTKEDFNWNVNDVLTNGYKKIVAKYTPSDNIILRSLYLVLPYGYETASTYLQLNKIPKTMVEFTLEDGSKKTYEFDWTNTSKEVMPQPTGQDTAYPTLGLDKNDKVTSFTITYENADGSNIDGRFAETVTSRYDVVPGTADLPSPKNRAEMRTEYVVTLADGTNVYRGPNTTNNYDGMTADRYTTIVNSASQPPKVEQRVDLLSKDGNVVTEGDNRVQLQIRNNNSSLTSITDDTTKIESVVILPLGVKLNSDPLAKYYIRSQRAYTFTENIPDGTISVLSDNYNGTGHQAVKVTWNRNELLPAESIYAEFGVTIDKNAPDSLTFEAYGFGTTFTDKMTEVVTASPITVETTDINGDGITGKDIVTRTNTFVKLTQHDLKIEKFVKGSFDTEYSKFAYTKPGGDIDYKITMTNTTGENIYKLGFLDVLPSVGDLGIVDNVSRGSAFAPALKGAITLPSEWQDKVTVYYSTEANPKRSDVLYNKVTYPTGAYVHQDPADAVDANWMVESEVTDWSTIKSFKIELNDNNIWVKGQDIELTFSMTAPEDLKADYVVNNESSQLPARTEELETKAAWNSFAVTTNTLLPTEPERVGVIVLNDTPPITKKVGDSTNGEYALDKNTQKFFYRINTRLPLDAQSFEVTDSLDKSLMLVENDPLKIVVNVDGSASTIVATSSTENGQTKISVKFDETFIKNNAGKDVEIIINAQVKPDADLSSYVDGKIPNTADYIINDNPETKKTTPPVNVVVKGTVIAQYFIEGTEDKLQDDKSVKIDEVVGEQYSDVPPKTLVKDGKTYVLVETNNTPTLKDSSAPQNGTVVGGIQEIKYQYKLASAPEIGKDVDGSTEKELSNVEEEFTYNINTTFPIGATTYEVSDKLVSELEYVSDSLRVLVDGNEFSEATVSSDGGVVRVTFSKAQIAANEGKEIKISFKANIKAGANLSKYENGKIPNTASYTIDGNPDTKKTTDPVNVSVKKGGEVLVQYVIQGTNDQLSDPSNTNTSADNPGMYIVQPKDTAVGTAYSTTPPATLVKDGKTYELVEIRKNPNDASASGKVTEDKQIVTYEYKLKEEPPAIGGNVQAQYFIKGTDTKLQDDKTVASNEPVGTSYTDVPPARIVKDGKTYILTVDSENIPELKDGSALPKGQVKTETQTIMYQYELVKDPEIGKDVDGTTEKELSNVEEEFTYNINTTFPIGATTYEVSDKLVDELEYVDGSIKVLVDNVEFTNAAVTTDRGIIKVSFTKPQIGLNESKAIKVTFKAKIKAGANLSKYADGKIPNTASYIIDGNPETKKTTDPVNVTVKKGGEVLVQYVIQGTDEQLSDPSNTNTSADNPGMYVVQPKDTAVGTEYSTTPPATLVKDGKTYELVEIRKNPTDASASGKVTEDKQIVTYEYKLKEEPPAIGGNVQAQYFIKGTDTKLQDDKTVASNEPVGTSYTDVPPERIVKDGKTYILTVDSENIPELKDGSALPKGQVKTETQTIMYQYEVVKDPEIGKDVDGTTEKELSNVEEEFTYNINTTFPIGATTYEVSDKLVDELEYVDGSIKVLVDNVEFTNAVVTTDRGIIKVSFTKPQIGLNESKAIKVTFKAKIKAGANLSKYENGKIPNTASYTIDGNPDTKKTSDPVNVTVKKGGEVLVQYVIQGTNDQLSDPSNTNPSADNPGMYIVQPKDTAVGTAYSTTPPATLVKAGKTYELVEIRKNPTDASASGKVTEDKQIVTYEYKLKEEPPVVTPKGSVIVHYEDESGKVIAPSNKIKDNAPVGEEYDSTTPKNRPNEITTDDGKVYELVKYDPKNGSDMPTGKVIEGTKNITYVYRLKTIPEISKKVDVDKIHLDVQTGKEYTYNITVKIPNDISNHNKFEITDELDSRLTVVGASITGDNSKYFNETKIEGNKVIASISDFAKADEIKGTSVELVITAKINNGVIIDKIPNSAVVVYNKNGLDGNPTEDNTTPPTPPVTVTPNYGGGSVVVKYEDENGNPIKDDNTVNPKGTAPGTPYDTTTINNRPKEIINNGKTYVLVKEDPKAGSDNPKGTVEDGKDKVVTYVYKLKEEVPETEKPSITKKINENIDYLLVENEKSFNYNIKTTIPIDIEKYTKFEISDAIDARLTVVNVTIKGDTQGLFTVTENNGVISAKMSDFAKAKEYAGKVIELVVTAKIKNGITSSIPNVASVTYNNTPGTTTDKKETTTPVTVVPKRPGTPITPNDNPSVPSFEEPKISKVINGSLLDLQIGNEKSFKYNITSYLPNDIANYTKYVITDKVDNNIKVVSAKVVGDASKYFDVVVKDNTVTATMKDFGNANVFAGKNIELEITSEINKGVKTVNIPNTATVSYRRSSGSESEKKSNTVYVTPNNNSNGTSSTNDNNNTTTTTTTNNNNIITKLPKTGDSNLTQIVGLVALSISLLLLSSYRKSKKL